MPSPRTGVGTDTPDLIRLSRAPDWLRDNGHRPISVEALGAAIRRGTLRPAHTVTVDGRKHHSFAPSDLARYAAVTRHAKV